MEKATTLDRFQNMQLRGLGLETYSDNLNEVSKIWPRLLRRVILNAAGINIIKHYNVGQSQRDGRPAEYRWRPLFNAAKFG